MSAEDYGLDDANSQGIVINSWLDKTASDDNIDVVSELRMVEFLPGDWLDDCNVEEVKIIKFEDGNNADVML